MNWIPRDRLDTIQSAIDDYRDGVPAAEVAQRHGLRNRQQLYYMLKKWGIERDRERTKTSEQTPCVQCEILCEGKLCQACKWELARGITYSDTPQYLEERYGH